MEALETISGELNNLLPDATHGKEMVVNLIPSTTTRQGLMIKAGLDESTYEAGIKVTDEELASLSIDPDQFHGGGNYRIKSLTIEFSQYEYNPSFASGGFKINDVHSWRF